MAAKKKVAEGTSTVKEQVVRRDTSIKFRCDFKTYDEYNKYKGKKG